MTKEQTTKANPEKAPYVPPALQRQQRLDEVLAGEANLVTHGRFD